MGMPTLRKRPRVKGGEVIARMLAAEGVEVVFGIVDGTYVALNAAFEPSGIALVTPRHEASAVHMAGAYARLTGGLGVCIASNGPGVANALSGVAVENVEGNRVLLITTCRRAGLMGPDRGGAYQHFDQVATIRPMAKFSCAVTSADRLAEVMRRALRRCYTGRPGVVHVDVSESVVNGAFQPAEGWLMPPSSYRPDPALPPSPELVECAAALLSESALPLIHAGSGVVHAKAYEQLAELAALLEAPVTTSWGARCAIDERDRHALPMVHIEAVNRARREADAVLVLGSRLGETDWWGKAPYWARPDAQRLVQVDIDPEILGNVRPADLLVQADVGLFLGRLSAARRRRGGAPPPARRAHLDDLRADVRKHRAKLDRHLEDRAAPMNTAHVAAACQRALPDDAPLILDGGNAAVWANFFHQVRAPGNLVGTPKMGMLGAGVSQAVAAAVARPGSPVCCIIGDGAMGFHQQEVECAVRSGLPILYLVVCDRQWGMVKMTQQFALRPLKTLVKKRLGPEDTINADLGEIRFDDLGRAMGAHGERVSDPAGLEGAIERSLAAGGCAVIHVDVDPTKHLWAPGLKYFKAMHQEPAG